MKLESGKVYLYTPPCSLAPPSKKRFLGYANGHSMAIACPTDDDSNWQCLLPECFSELPREPTVMYIDMACPGSFKVASAKRPAMVTRMRNSSYFDEVDIRKFVEVIDDDES